MHVECIIKELEAWAGEQGPSCKTLKQILNLKLIHVRFIPEIDIEVEEIENMVREDGLPEASKPSQREIARSFTSPPKAKKAKIVPKSFPYRQY